MNNYAIINGLIDSVIRDFIILQLYFAAKAWCHPSATFVSHRTLSPPSPHSPNHYMTYLDPVPLAIVKEDSNIANFFFQVERSVSLG